eukprot:TRINITY_DN12750_c0_g1_i10.p1 TRINITY_DN12750_c0_g1~~TRINITY_DN12750_c0_g1_i10.p1  ORF type:complete len:748 (-),score=171.72 TRINITY_DN12750_c0_g1_i10:1577-3793(-)
MCIRDSINAEYGEALCLMLLGARRLRPPPVCAARLYSTDQVQSSKRSLQKKATVLRQLLHAQDRQSFIMEAHNGLSARIVEEAGFEGIWAGSLAISATLGVRSDEEVSWNRVLEVVDSMANCTTIPILLDAGKQLNHDAYASTKGVQRAIRKMESRGIAGVTLNDSYGRRSNSFLDDDDLMVDAAEFCHKLQACKEALNSVDFQLVACVNSLVDGEGVEEALERAEAYATAGADALLLATARGAEGELQSFLAGWDKAKECPVIMVGDTMSRSKMSIYSDLGVKTFVWSNQNMRSSIASMQKVTKRIWQDHGPQDISGDPSTLVPVQEVFRLNKDAEDKVLEAAPKVWNRARPIDEMTRNFVHPAFFLKQLRERKTEFFTGVPDSILRDVCQYIDDNVAEENHVIAANEGAAIGLAAGHYLATGNVPLVYFQNSGLGNAVNPLLSLPHKEVYGIPMLLLIGWRGEPGKRDEPHHHVQGRIMEKMLEMMDVPCQVLPDWNQGAAKVLDEAYARIEKDKAPYALLVKRATFSRYDRDFEELGDLEGYTLRRQEAIEAIMDGCNNDTAILATTGFTARELYEMREDRGQPQQDFLQAGSMGLTSSISLGLALAKPDVRFVCLDGDGANLMHLGTMQTIGKTGAQNLCHVLINNGSHDSVGGQPSGGYGTDFVNIAKACGYANAESVSDPDDLTTAIQKMKLAQGPNFLEVRVVGGADVAAITRVRVSDHEGQTLELIGTGS